ncbi:MAG: dienelactone hydrolase family protein [Alphaproteobacteria bacterium]|nr:dienelactone hydrolase family protein [Alphaproteobacteria bacterium]
MAWRSTASRILGAAFALAAMVPVARGQPAAGPQPALVRSFFELPVTIDRASIKLEAMEIRPRGAGPFPLAVIAHGKDGGEDKRRAQSAVGMTSRALAFARRGFVTVVAMRRGYGTSQGQYAENDGTCEATRYLDASRAGARDLVATVAAAAARPGVDRARILVVGDSVGGINALALATTPPPGVLGVVNFAGGRGGDPAEPGKVCQPDRLIEAVRSFGAAGKLPTLWIYAENDRLFSAALARQMYQSYVSPGGKATLAMLPPIGRDGHRVFMEGGAAWREPLDAFLRQHGLPTLAPAPAPAMPAGLGANGQAVFQAYLLSPLPYKAFASSGDGLTGWAASPRARDEARRAALANCQKGGRNCDVVSEVAEIEDR